MVLKICSVASIWNWALSNLLWLFQLVQDLVKEGVQYAVPMFNEMIESVVGQKFMYVWDVVIPVVIFRDFE